MELNTFRPDAGFLPPSACTSPSPRLASSSSTSPFHRHSSCQQGLCYSPAHHRTAAVRIRNSLRCVQEDFGASPREKLQAQGERGSWTSAHRGLGLGGRSLTALHPCSKLAVALPRSTLPPSLPSSLAMSLLSARPLQASLPSLSRTLSSTATPRPNKRTTASAASTSSLISLYHLSPTFLPLSPSSVDPTICHTFAPDSNSYGSQYPKNFPELVLARQALQMSAIAHDVKRAFPDLNASRVDASTGYSMAGDDGPTYDKSFESVFTRGSEPPLRKRWRRVMDKLYGTEAGGQAGVQTLLENGDEWKLEGQSSERVRERRIEQEDELELHYAEEEAEALRMVGEAGEASPRA